MNSSSSNTTASAGENSDDTNATKTTLEDATQDDTASSDKKNSLEDNDSQNSNSSENDTQSESNSKDSEAALSNDVIKLGKLEAGSIVNTKELGDTIMDKCFYYEEITDAIKTRIVGKSYGEGCIVPFETLRYIRVLYYGFDDETHIGEMIVNKGIADDIIDIFKELYEAKYPIEKMVLVDEYNADDNASMAANNSSSFNYRVVPGSTHLSNHALGLAIDINPLYNPYVQYNATETIILPEEGIPYADRTLDCPYYIDEDDLCYKAFTDRGFTWGGIWKRDPDYQHFEKEYATQ